MSQKEVVVLTSFNTPFQQVKKDSQYVRYMLEKKGVEVSEAYGAPFFFFFFLAQFEEVDGSTDWARRDALWKISGVKALPQVFIDKEYVGGYSEVERLEETEQLSRALGLPNDEPEEEENTARNPTGAPAGPGAPGDKKKKASDGVGCGERLTSVCVCARRRRL